MPYEQGSLLQLIRTDNKVLNKIVTVFAALISEMDILMREGENKYCWGLSFYGEGPEAVKDKGENLISMGKFISFFQELSCYIKRCYEVIKLSLYQLMPY